MTENPGTIETPTTDSSSSRNSENREPPPSSSSRKRRASSSITTNACKKWEGLRDRASAVAIIAADFDKPDAGEDETIWRAQLWCQLILD